jgi:hypothetical protein
VAIDVIVVTVVIVPHAATVPHVAMEHLATMIGVLSATMLALAISHVARVVPILRLLPNCRSGPKPSASRPVQHIARLCCLSFPKISVPLPNSRCRECKQFVSASKKPMLH